MSVFAVPRLPAMAFAGRSEFALLKGQNIQWGSPALGAEMRTTGATRGRKVSVNTRANKPLRHRDLAHVNPSQERARLRRRARQNPGQSRKLAGSVKSIPND